MHGSERYRLAFVITFALLALLAAAVSAAKRNDEFHNFLPLVNGYFSGPGYPTATVTPTQTPTPAATQTAIPSRTPTASSADAYFDITNLAGISAGHQLMAGCGGVHWGTGSAWADVDNDGKVDLFSTNHGGPNRLFHNQGDTNQDMLPEFKDIAASLGIDDPNAGSSGSVFIDYDNDGDQDLYVTQLGANKLYQNQIVDSGELSFIDVTALSGTAGAGGLPLMSAWGDYDQDGHLDFMITRHVCSQDTRADQLFHSEGDGSFSDVSGLLCPGGVAPCSDLEGLGFATGWFDYDNDGDLDLYQANDQISPANEPNKLWENAGSNGSSGWIFNNVSAASHSDLGINSMGLGIGDYNNDGWLDIALSDIGPAEVLKNLGTGEFELDSTASGLSSATNGTSWSTVFLDYDNDGWLDLYFTRGIIYVSVAAQTNAGGTPNMLVKNDGDGTFTHASAASGVNDSGTGRNASIVDVNGDGFVDILINNLDTGLHLFLNQAPSQGSTQHWLVFTVEGTTSNRDGIGTRISITANGLTQVREITSGPTHGGGDYRAAFFGLGVESGAEVSVRWPDGSTQSMGHYAADQQVHLVEPTSQALGLPGTESPSGLSVIVIFVGFLLLAQFYRFVRV
jgi:hypothetical protein